MNRILDRFDLLEKIASKRRDAFALMSGSERSAFMKALDTVTVMIHEDDSEIMDVIDNSIEEMCDQYCMFPDMCTTEAMLDGVCVNCPLTKLRKELEPNGK